MLLRLLSGAGVQHCGSLPLALWPGLTVQLGHDFCWLQGASEVWGTINGCTCKTAPRCALLRAVMTTNVSQSYQQCDMGLGGFTSEPPGMPPQAALRLPCTCKARLIYA